MKTKKLIFIFVSAMMLLTSGMASAQDVLANVTRWESRTDSNWNTSSIFYRGDYKTDVPARGLYLRLYDMDGNCRDFASGCSEADDDYLGFGETNINGFYKFSSIGTGQDVYFHATYTNDMAGIRDSSDNSRVVLSQVTDNVSGTELINWSITCPTLSDGTCDTQTWADYWPTNQVWSNLYGTLTDIEYTVSHTTRTINGHNNRIIAYYPTSPSGDKCDGYSGLSWGV